MRVSIPRPRLPSAVQWLTVAAFVLRLVARLCEGIDAFWVNGYTLFFEIAQGIGTGKGIALANGVPTAFRVPLYPILLAGLTLGHHWFWPIAIAQSLIGAGTTFCTALLARQMYEGTQGQIAAIVAAAMTAIYPYYVVHDTALQETSLFTLLTLVAVIIAQRAARTGALLPAATCGLVLGLDVLTRSPIAPFALIVPLWLAARNRIMQGLLSLLALALMVAPWIMRNYLLTGEPVLTTEAGFELWNGNNAMLFETYPMQSVDVSISAHVDALNVPESRDTPPSGASDVAVDRWFEQRALGYIRAHPGLTFTDGLRKIGATFDWLPTPRRSLAQTLAHAFSFGPVMLLGVWGMWLRRSRWREDSLIYLLFVQFVIVTAIYFGQTNHRVFLDVYFIVFGAGAIAARLLRARAETSLASANFEPCR